MLWIIDVNVRVTFMLVYQLASQEEIFSLYIFLAKRWCRFWILCTFKFSSLAIILSAVFYCYNNAIIFWWKTEFCSQDFKIYRKEASCISFVCMERCMLKILLKQQTSFRKVYPSNISLLLWIVCFTVGIWKQGCF